MNTATIGNNERRILGIAETAICPGCGHDAEQTGIAFFWNEATGEDADLQCPMCHLNWPAADLNPLQRSEAECPECGAAAAYIEVPSMAAFGTDWSIRCKTCGFSDCGAPDVS